MKKTILSLATAVLLLGTTAPAAFARVIPKATTGRVITPTVHAKTIKRIMIKSSSSSSSSRAAVWVSRRTLRTTVKATSRIR